MKFFQWLHSLLHRRKRVYHVQIPVGFQLNEQIKLALFGESEFFMKGG